MIGSQVRQLLVRRALQQARQQIRKDHGGSPYTYNIRGSVSIVSILAESFGRRSPGRCSISRDLLTDLANFISSRALLVDDLTLLSLSLPPSSLFVGPNAKQNLPFDTTRPRLLFFKLLAFCAVPYWLPFFIVRHQVKPALF